MVEKAERSEVGTEPRGDPTREWEVFVREDADDPLRHVGSVSAPDAEIAHEQASRLFAWYAEGLWLCPAEEVHRFSTHDLGEDAAEEETELPRDATEASDSEGSAETADTVVDEDDTATYHAEASDEDEPRVTEL
jgi:rSAM-partnered protein